MRLFHILTVSSVKSLTIEQLSRILDDFELRTPPTGKKIVKRDLVQVIQAYVDSAEYRAHVGEYQRHSFRPIHEVPAVYRTRARCLQSGQFEYYHDEDKTFEVCLNAARNPANARRIPMERFTPSEREKLIAACSSVDILERVPVPEIVACLKRWPLALSKIPYAQQTSDMCFACVKATGFALEFCAPWYVTHEMELMAITNTPAMIKWVQRDNPIRYNALEQVAILLDPWVIEDIEQTPENRIMALARDWTVHQLLTLPLSDREQSMLDHARAIDKQEKEAARVHVTIDD